MKYCEIDLSRIQIKIKGKCKFFKENQNINLEKINKKICLTALHTILPYYFSFLDGAWFKWEKDKNIVTAFCPIGKVGMDIIRNKDSILIRVREGSCNKIKDRFKLEFKDFCPRLLYNIYPYLFLDSKKIEVYCPGCEDGRINILINKK